MTATITPVGAVDDSHDDAHDEIDDAVDITDRIDHTDVAELVAPPVTTSITTRAAAREAHGRTAQPVFVFDGNAAGWAGAGIRALLLTVFTLGVCYPFALVATEQWRTGHTLVDGRRLQFTGTAGELYPRWIGDLLLILVTLGIYSFWVHPRLTRWVIQHRELLTSR